jgi:branched-chain amino acid transport system substrate-binding protein
MILPTSLRGLRKLPRPIVVTLALTALAACASTPPPPPPPPPPPVVTDPEVTEPEVIEPEIIREGGLIPHHLEGREVTRAALLLPFSHPNAAARNEAANLLQAAELALFEHGPETLILMPKDTGGTNEGARQAAQAAIDDGADIILGPLFGAAATAAGDVARRYDVPVLAFSTDTSIAGNGVYLLSLPPEQEVARITAYVARLGVERFAFIGPGGAYGSAVRDALAETAELNGGYLAAEETYVGGVEAMTSAARRLSQLGFTSLEARDAMMFNSNQWVPSTNAPFQAVMLPEGGTRLRTLGPLLPYHEIDPLIVRFLGTGLWNDEETRREPVLHGGWFAGPDAEAHSAFSAQYQSAFGDEPSRIASHAYDAVLLAVFFANEGEVSREALEDPEGFYGADGLFRFRADGRIERGLAVYEVRRDGFRVIDPAPRSFDPAVF